MQTTTTQTERNITMYGFADMDAYMDSVKRSITYKFTGGHMIVAGLMSDAQEQWPTMILKAPVKLSTLLRLCFFKLWKAP